MGRLTPLPVWKVIKCFEKLGYEVVRQRGSHVRLHHKYRNPLTIPYHDEIGVGLLRKLIRDAGITVEHFMKILEDL